MTNSFIAEKGDKMKYAYWLISGAILLCGCPMLGNNHGKHQYEKPSVHGDYEDNSSESSEEATVEDELPCTELYNECVINGVQQDICNDLLAECEYNEQVSACEDLYEDCIADHISPELCGEMLDDCLTVDDPDGNSSSDDEGENDEGDEEDTGDDEQDDEESDPTEGDDD